MTTNTSWGYNRGDPDWKSARDVARTLMTCAHNGGNLLLNVGPRADGTMPRPACRLLETVGGWVERNGEAIYGTDPHPFAYADQRLSTARGNVVYVALPHYHGPQTTIAGVGNRVRRVRVLADGSRVRFAQEGNRVFLNGLPRRPPDILPVVAMELDGKPRGVPNPYLAAGAG
jgi:alpha-L-fucosidase